MKCPKHKKELQETDIVKYNNRKTVGKNLFCPEDGCDFEIDVKNSETKKEEI